MRYVAHIIYYFQLVGLSGAAAEQIRTADDLNKKIGGSLFRATTAHARCSICSLSLLSTPLPLRHPRKSHSQERSVRRKAYNLSRNSVINQFLAHNYLKMELPTKRIATLTLLSYFTVSTTRHVRGVDIVDQAPDVVQFFRCSRPEGRNVLSGPSSVPPLTLHLGARTFSGRPMHLLTVTVARLKTLEIPVGDAGY